MDCIVLAGGKGTRLRPLTLATPKPMVRLLGEPILRHIIANIAKADIEKTVVTLGYKGEVIERYFQGDNPPLAGVEFHREQTPLGTAGAVKSVADRVGDTFLVLSGDAYFEFDLGKIMDAHRQSGADVTIVAKEVDDPREYGLVQADEKGCITGFREKPSFTGVTSAYGNTGIYVVNKSVLRFIPPNTPFDFAKDLFPLLLREKKRLYMSVQEGYWCDIGDISTYLSCQRYLLQKGERPHWIGPGVQVDGSAKLVGNCVLEQGVQIGARCTVQNSVLLGGAVLAPGCRVENAVIGEGAVLRENTVVSGNCAVGARAVLNKNVKLQPNVRVFANKTVSEGVLVTENVQNRDLEQYRFSERGLTGTIGEEMTPVVAVKLGLSIGAVNKVNRVLVAVDDTAAAEVFADGLLAGLGASAVKTGVMKNSFWGEFLHSLRQGEFQLGVFVSTQGREISFRTVDPQGLTLFRETEREIEQNLNREQFSYAIPAHFAKPQVFHSAEKYFAKLEKLGGGLTHFLIEFQCENKNLEIKLNNLTQYNDIHKKMVTVCLDKGGHLIKLRDDKGREFSKTQLYLLAALQDLQDKKDVVCESSFPKVMDALAEGYRGRVYRYQVCPLAGEDKRARQLAAKTHWVTDDILLAFKVLHFANRENSDIETLFRKIPAFCALKTQAIIGINPGKILQSVAEEFTREQDGVVITRGSANAILQASKDGKGLNLYVDGPTLEEVNALNAYLQRRIKTVELDTMGKKNYN